MNSRLIFVSILCSTLIFTGMECRASVGTVSKEQGKEKERLFTEGKKFYDQGDFSRSIRSWDKVLDDPLYGPVAYIMTARSQLRLSRPEAAATALREFLAKWPNSPYENIARDALMDALSGQGKPEALGMLQTMTKSAPKEDIPRLMLRSAMLERRLGNYAEAAAHCRKLMLDYPASPEGLAASEELTRLVFLGKTAAPQFSEQEQLSRAESLFKNGRFDLAGQIYGNLLSKAPSDDKLKLKFARCLYGERRNREAIQLLKKSLDGKVSDKERIEALHLLSLLYWRVDMEKEFEEACNRIIDKGPPDMKRKALYNLGAHHLEKHRLDKAESYFKQFLKNGPDRSGTANAMWKTAWIKYSRKQYTDAVLAFKAAAAASPGGRMHKPARYWQARSLILSNRRTEAEPLLRDLARNHPCDYYGIEAQRLLKSMGAKPDGTRPAEKAFPDMSLTGEQRALPLISNAEKLMAVGAHEFALLNLDALPAAVKSSTQVAFLRAKAAHGAGQYRKARDILSPKFAGLMENPPANAPRDFVEVAYPRVHIDETVRNAAKHSVDPYLVWAVIRQESLYDESAISPAGALGLMQVTPEASGLAKSKDKVPAAVIAKIVEPKKNIALGTGILAKNLRTFKGDLVPAIASYNADLKKVRDWVRKNGKMKQDEFVESIPYLETRLYVKKVLAGYRTYTSLHKRKDLAGYW